MLTNTDKRDRALTFRTRLAEAMGARGTSQSALARAVRVDRSTISQLLSGETPRLPNAQVVAGCAVALGVSADWLLGLSEHPEPAADVMAASLAVTEAPRALVDEQIYAWHREAAGYKIRHVPAGLPDMLKTHAMLRWEYAPYLGRTTEQAISASDDRQAWMRELHSDYEIALPLYEVAAFVRAEGYYADLPRDVRDAQIEHMLNLHVQFFPSMRLFLFDARRLFSAPVTIFGPRIAVIYIGQHYLAFRDSERVQVLSRHFDMLVREATVDARDFAAHLENLRAESL